MSEPSGMNIKGLVCGHDCDNCKQSDCLCAGGDGRYKKCPCASGSFVPPTPEQQANRTFQYVAEELGRTDFTLICQVKGWTIDFPRLSVFAPGLSEVIELTKQKLGR